MWCVLDLVYYCRGRKKKISGLLLQVGAGGKKYNKNRVFETRFPYKSSFKGSIYGGLIYQKVTDM